jgi:hypothetical protein
VAEAGGPRRALVKELPVPVGAGGVIDIAFEGANGLATVSGIEIEPASYRNSLAINCGGDDAWPFIQDRLYQGGTSEVQIVEPDMHGLDLSDADCTVPSAVFRSERFGDFTYTFPGLPPGASCLVSLYFCEFYWAKSGSRIFDVLINGVPVLTEFDILAEVGSPLKPTARKYIAVADGDGKVVVEFRSIENWAQATAIELHW